MMIRLLNPNYLLNRQISHWWTLSSNVSCSLEVTKMLKQLAMWQTNYSKCCQEACWPFLASEDITDRNHTNLKPTSASIQYWWNVNVFSFICLTFKWLTWYSVQTRFLVATRSQESAAAVFSTHLPTADEEVSLITASYRSRGRSLGIWMKSRRVI